MSDVIAFSLFWVIVFTFFYRLFIRGVFVRRFLCKYVDIKKYKTKEVLEGCVIPWNCYGGLRGRVGYYIISCNRPGSLVNDSYLVVVMQSCSEEDSVMYTNSSYENGLIERRGLGFRPRNLFDRAYGGVACDGVCYVNGKVMYFFEIKFSYKSLIEKVFDVVEFAKK